MLRPIRPIYNDTESITFTLIFWVFVLNTAGTHPDQNTEVILNSRLQKLGGKNWGGLSTACMAIVASVYSLAGNHISHHHHHHSSSSSGVSWQVRSTKLNFSLHFDTPTVKRCRRLVIEYFRLTMYVIHTNATCDASSIKFYSLDGVTLIFGPTLQKVTAPSRAGEILC